MLCRDKPITLTAMGHYHPENRINNSVFKQLDIGDPSWIEEKTGIRSRRSVLTPQDLLRLRRGNITIQELRNRKKIISVSEMAKKSWDMLRRRYGSGFSNIDLMIYLMICGTSIPDYYIPADACTIAERLELSCTGIDMNSDCTSFIVGLHLARSLLRDGNIENIAIINPERYTTRLDFPDHSSCVLFGDGCTAAVVTRVCQAGGLELIDTLIDGLSSQFPLVTVPVDGLFCQQGAAVQKHAVRKTVDTVQVLLRRNNLSVDDIDYFIGHQANYKMLMSVTRKLGIEPGKHLHNVREYANEGGSRGAGSLINDVESIQIRRFNSSSGSRKRPLLGIDPIEEALNKNNG